MFDWRDAPDVFLDSAGGQEQGLGDVVVGGAVGDLPFPG